MSSTSQVTTFSDLYTDLQNRVRLQTGVTATENQAKRYINIALQDMHVGFAEKFPWCHRTATLVTQAQYTTGTISVSQGGTAVTGASTAWATANVFGINNARTTGKLVISGGVEAYGISAVGSDTSITLASRFTQSDVSAGTYVYFEDEYALASDFLRPISYTSFDIAGTIDLIGWIEFRRRYPRNKTTGKPRIATIVDRAFSGSTTPARHVIFFQPPDQNYTISYDYVTANLGVTSAGTEQSGLSSDSDEPIVPLRYRHAIVFHALYHWYRDKKDDTRSQEAKGEYTDMMLRMTGDTEIGRPLPRFVPPTRNYRSYARAPYSGMSRGRWTAGNAFDEMR